MKPVLTPKQKRLWNRLLKWLEMPARTRRRLGYIKFNMDTWTEIKERVDDLDTETLREKKIKIQECTTACCIGGFVVLDSLSKGKLMVDRTGRWYGDDDDGKAADLLGMEYDLAHELFYPFGSRYGLIPWDKIRGKAAARVVRHYLETGEVDWSLALSKKDRKYHGYI